MAKKPAIGHLTCHVCGFEESEVKLSEKSGLAFTFCPDCNVQSFARTQFQHDKLLAKMRPVNAPKKESEPQKIETQEVEKPVENIKPKFSLEDL